MKAILPLAFALTLILPAVAQDAPKSGPMTVDLATALRLAGARNTEIARAREAVAQAASQLRQKRYLLIPALTVGASVEHHDGPLQESSGRVRNISRTSANFGVGAGAIAAGPVGAPGISLSVDHADELARLTADFAKSGEGLESDAQRARVEQFIQQRELEQAMEAVAITRARLASLLHLEADVALHPADTDVAPLSVTDADAKLGELIATALQSRPEIKQGSAQVRLASDRLRQSRYSPWIPNLALGASASAFGGGVGGGVKNVDGRADVTALAFWRWEAFGLTEAEKVKERKSEMLQQEFARQSSVDQIIAEVRQAHAQTDSRRRQIAFAEQAVAAARSSYELNRSRIFEKQGLPIEVLQAIQSLARARALYIDTVTDFNQSQYRLLTAIGNGTDQ